MDLNLTVKQQVEKNQAGDKGVSMAIHMPIAIMDLVADLVQEVDTMVDR
jgi:hypothetical protein